MIFYQLFTTMVPRFLTRESWQRAIFQELAKKMPESILQKKESEYSQLVAEIRRVKDGRERQAGDTSCSSTTTTYKPY